MSCQAGLFDCKRNSMRTLVHIAMIIPHRMLSPETLRGVIEAFVTHEGTDYGAEDTLLETKVVRVRQQLDDGTAVIVYAEDTVVYPNPADNVSGPLSTRLRHANQPAISPRNMSSTPCPSLLASI
jgi:uncharacterized protein YheU (UPF0270 family)